MVWGYFLFSFLIARLHECPCDRCSQDASASTLLNELPPFCHIFLFSALGCLYGFLLKAVSVGFLSLELDNNILFISKPKQSLAPLCVKAQEWHLRSKQRSSVSAEQLLSSAMWALPPPPVAAEESISTSGGLQGSTGIQGLLCQDCGPLFLKPEFSSHQSVSPEFLLCGTCHLILQ